MKTTTATQQIALLASGLLLFAACEEMGAEGFEDEFSTDDDISMDEADDEDAPGEDARVEGVMIHSLALSDTHTMDFYTMNEGGTLVHETASIDADEHLLTAGLPEGTTLSEIFEMVAPDQEIPQALIDADYSDVLEGFDEAQADMGDDLNQYDDVVDDTMSQGSCSPDYYNDNWGAQWFLNNFCNQGLIRNCSTLWPRADRWGVKAKWLSWQVMAGDFWHGARTWGEYKYSYSSCNPWPFCSSTTTYRTLFDFPIQARYIDGVTFSSSGYTEYRLHATDNQGCPRVHYAQGIK